MRGVALLKTKTVLESLSEGLGFRVLAFRALRFRV